jgi:D-alanyl-D-alanine carboxypeptidase (penicillin-binding protein 5/6)
MRLLAPLFLLFVTLQAAPLQVDVSARSAILINAETGRPLFEKNPHAPAYPASITKIATALYMLEMQGQRLEEQAVAAHEALAVASASAKQTLALGHPPYRLEPEGSHIGIRVGEVLPLKALLHGLLIASGNDAANVIAHHVAGDVGAFMEDLNLFLKAKGIKETHFLNPHGLHHPDHQTTAHDMALITREALKHPLFRQIVRTVRYPRPGTNKQPETVIVQTNKLLRQGGEHYYPKAIGVKTGHTSHANYTLVAAAEHEGRTLIAVLLDAPDMHQRYRDAIRLFEAAFHEKPIDRVLFTQAHDQFTQPVRGGKREAVQAALKRDFILTYFPAEEPSFRTEVVWRTLKLPIFSGDEVGELRLLGLQGEKIATAPLFALETVEKTAWREVADLAIAYRRLFIITALALNIALLLLYYRKKSKKFRQG